MEKLKMNVIGKSNHVSNLNNAEIITNNNPLEEINIMMTDFDYVGPKGSGYFCIVKKFVNRKTKAVLAVKELKKDFYQREDYRYRFSREIELLKRLADCDSIIDLVYHGNDKEKEKTWYAMPYAEDNLYNYIKINNAKLTKEDRINIFDQILKAITYAHSKGIIHRDLSPNNVLVFNEPSFSVKVSDFGLGKDIDAFSHYTGSNITGYGQFLYVSPEQREQLKDGTILSDIYSLGKILYFVCTGKQPLDIKPCEFSTLISRATEEEPSARPQSIEEFTKHYEGLKFYILEDQATKNLTMKDYLRFNTNSKVKNWLEFHQFATKGECFDHVYDDYLDPVLSILEQDGNLSDYYNVVGNSIKQFVNIFVEKVNKCLETTGWPFTSMNNFGNLLAAIYDLVNDDDVKLLCLQEIWRLGYSADQWKVQDVFKRIVRLNTIPESIAVSFAQFVSESGATISIDEFQGTRLPNSVKRAIERLQVSN